MGVEAGRDDERQQLAVGDRRRVAIGLLLPSSLVQVSLCRKAEVLPAERARSVLRGCQVAAIIMTATLASCWISVVVGANRAQWNSTATVLVAGLAVVTGLDIRAVLMLVRTPRLGRSGPSRSEAPDDWLGDAVLVARRESRWFGPFRSLVMSVVAWCDRTVVARLRLVLPRSGVYGGG